MTKTTPEQIFSNPDFDVEGFIHHVRLYTDSGGRNLVRSLCFDPNILLSIIASDDYELAERQGSGYDPEIFLKALPELGLEVWSRTTRAKSHWIGFCLDENIACYYHRIANQSGYLRISKGLEIATKHKEKWFKDGMRKAGEAPAKSYTRYKPGTRPIDYFRKEFINQMIEIGCLGFYSNNGIKPHIFFYTEPYRSTSRIQRRLWVTQKSPKRVSIQYRKDQMTRYNSFGKTQWQNSKIINIDDEGLAKQAIDWICSIDDAVKELRTATNAGL